MSFWFSRSFSGCKKGLLFDEQRHMHQPLAYTKYKKQQHYTVHTYASFFPVISLPVSWGVSFRCECKIFKKDETGVYALGIGGVKNGDDKNKPSSFFRLRLADMLNIYIGTAQPFIHLLYSGFGIAVHEHLCCCFRTNFFCYDPLFSISRYYIHN